jgi:hypothetical protein
MLIKKEDLLQKKLSKCQEKKFLHNQTNGKKNSKDFSKRSLLRQPNSRLPQTMSSPKRVLKRIQHNQCNQVILKSKLFLKRMRISK